MAALGRLAAAGRIGANDRIRIPANVSIAVCLLDAG